LAVLFHRRVAKARTSSNDLWNVRRRITVAVAAIMLVNKSHYCMAAGAIVRKPRALHAGLA